MKKLPLQEWKLEHCPAIPYWADQYGDPDLEHIAATVINLNGRGLEATPTAYHGLSTEYTIDGQKNVAYEFLFDEPLPGGPPGKPQSTASQPPSRLALETQDDFTLSWTTYKDMYKDSQAVVQPFADSLKYAEAATQSFWPTIASVRHWRTTSSSSRRSTQSGPGHSNAELGDAWAAEEMSALQAKGLLYEIDMRILASARAVHRPRRRRALHPRHHHAAEAGPADAKRSRRSRSRSPPRAARHASIGTGTAAWLYALQAAKTSITVWGIWLGHVYHWHIVTAAMQMTMYNRLPAGHKLYALMQPQSQSLIDFDFVLLSSCGARSRRRPPWTATCRS